MLSLRIFGEDITKPHTANVRGTQPESTDQQNGNAVEQARGLGASEAGDADQKPEVDEEAALNA